MNKFTQTLNEFFLVRLKFFFKEAEKVAKSSKKGPAIAKKKNTKKFQKSVKIEGF